MLFEGFVKPGKLNDDRLWVKYDLRNILITILLHGGGLRVSEPFHIYCHDVISDPYDSGQCVVRVYHPSDGLIKDVDTITGKPVDKTRSQYLQDRFDLRPRHEIFGREHAGWKDLFLDEARSQFYINVHWFPRYWGVLFRSFYALYVKHVLPVNMKHPYAFICTGKRYFGKPYTIASFREAHKGAVLKIGLEYKKEYGTTPHGHRHAYGQNLKASGVRERHIQACMHHRSPLSQLVYTEPTYREIDAILSSTSQKVPNYRTIQEKLGKHFNVSIEELLRELVR